MSLDTSGSTFRHDRYHSQDIVEAILTEVGRFAVQDDPSIAALLEDPAKTFVPR